GRPACVPWEGALMPVEIVGLEPALAASAQAAEQSALEVGLRPGWVRFQGLERRHLHALAARGGYPVRHRAWRFGMEFHRLERGARQGSLRLLELVTPGDPTVASLDRANRLPEQRLVLTHVLAHADLFGASRWFSGVGQGFLGELARNAGRVEDWVQEHGAATVERRLELLQALAELVDPELLLRGAYRARSSERDLLGTLAAHDRLAGWERDLVSVARSEAYGLLPQRLTRITNEGWASLWHSTLLPAEHLRSVEATEFAGTHARATAAAPGELNPYRLGLELLRHAAGQGRDLLALRAWHRDESLVEELLDEEFALESELVRARAGDEPVRGAGEARPAAQPAGRRPSSPAPRGPGRGARARPRARRSRLAAGRGGERARGPREPVARSGSPSDAPGR
ncbi:MAG: SpoVR family protein, partial [Planctomycetota bacterium]|nr:SpoVR family protein [Planctomycetota bacterium]